LTTQLKVIPLAVMVVVLLAMQVVEVLMGIAMLTMKILAEVVVVMAALEGLVAERGFQTYQQVDLVVRLFLRLPIF
jgi:hypothetical protein